MTIDGASQHNRTLPLAPEAELAAKIRLVMAEARQAAADAVACLPAPVGSGLAGSLSDLAGAAFVYASKPSYDFREAMFDAGEISESLSGRWPIGRFQEVTDDTSITAAETACRAALGILRTHFPDETFETTSYPT